MNYFELIKRNQKLAKALHKDPEVIRLLVLELSHLDGATFLAQIQETQKAEVIDSIQAGIDRYLYHNEPLQYIVGYVYFYGYQMQVNDHVLIPRPETEELVGHVLGAYDEFLASKAVKVLDIGTGSGAIAIALAKEEPLFKVSASDISVEALEVAQTNAVKNEAKIDFYCGNMLDPFIERNDKADIIVSNPPYIPNQEFVEDIVKDNEPHVALFGGDDGLKFYNEILAKASLVLNVPGIIAFEHGYNKRVALTNLIKQYFPQADIETFQDMQGKDRITIVKVSK